jgi:hypothetical protein
MLCYAHIKGAKPQTNLYHQQTYKVYDNFLWQSDLYLECKKNLLDKFEERVGEKIRAEDTSGIGWLAMTTW